MINHTENFSQMDNFMINFFAEELFLPVFHLFEAEIVIDFSIIYFGLKTHIYESSRVRVNSFSTGTVFICQNLTSEMVPALK